MCTAGLDLEPDELAYDHEDDQFTLLRGDNDDDAVRLYLLPSLVIERILAYLSLAQRLSLRLVCKAFNCGDRHLWDSRRILNVQHSMQKYLPHKCSPQTSVADFRKALRALFGLYAHSRVESVSYNKPPGAVKQLVYVAEVALDSSTLLPINLEPLKSVHTLDLTGCALTIDDLLCLRRWYPNTHILTVSTDRLFLKNLKPDDSLTTNELQLDATIDPDGNMQVDLDAQPRLKRRVLLLFGIFDTLKTLRLVDGDKTATVMRVQIALHTIAQ